MALVVLGRAGGLMVHQNLHTFAMRVLVKHLNIEIGVGGYKVEHVAFPEVCPVFPTYVPTFYQHLVKPVLGGKVDITFYLLVIGGMSTIGLYLAPIDAVELDAGIFIGVVPTALAHNHLPPYATVFCGMNPRGVFYLTGLVQIQDEVV